MTFPHFLDAAHTLLVEECLRSGIDLFKIPELMEDREQPEEAPKPQASQPPTLRVPTAAENQESMKQLQVMLAGVKK